MRFPTPPIRVRLVHKDDRGNEVLHPDWQKWVNKIQQQLSTATTPVTGAKAGNAALASLISVLVSKGIVTDNTTP